MISRPLAALAVIAALLGALVHTFPASAAACTPTATTAGGDGVLTFSTVGSCEWIAPAGVTSVRVVVVAGGGGGGVNYRGGGGAGGVIEQAAVAVSPGAVVDVTVGTGGSGAYYGAAYTGWWHNQYANTVNATNGGDSTFGSITTLGGGFASGGYTPAIDAGSGGSGGGSTGGVAGAGTPGQGYAGSTWEVAGAQARQPRARWAHPVSRATSPVSPLPMEVVADAKERQEVRAAEVPAQASAARFSRRAVLTA